MYISYAPLWQTLQKKSLKKTDLLELTGMSSRTLAKLSANESVTVETLAKLCEVLGCPIEEVIAITETPECASLYDAFRQSTAVIFEDDFVFAREVLYAGRTYHIYFSKKKASNFTIITCQSPNVVEWAEMPFSWRLNGTPYGEGKYLFAERVQPGKGHLTLFVADGKPRSIEGLDAGIFRSAGHPGGEEHLHVMSLARFKMFQMFAS